MNHLQIARQIKALERAVLAFQPAMVGAVGRQGAPDTNLAIILSARLAHVWKRIGKILPSHGAWRERAGSALRRQKNGTESRNRGKECALMA